MMKSVLTALFFIAISINHGDSQSAYADSILSNAVTYFKKSKSEVTIYEAQLHLDSVRKYFPESHRVRTKMESAIIKLNSDESLLAKEKLRLQEVNADSHISLSKYSIHIHIGSFVLFGLLVYWIRKLMKQKSILKGVASKWKKANDALQLGTSELERQLELSTKNLRSKEEDIDLLRSTITLEQSEHKQLSTAYNQLIEKYKDIIDMDEEVDRKSHQFQELKEKYKRALIHYNKLKHDNAVMLDNLEIGEFGVYEPHFNFDTSEKYKISLRLKTEDRKALIRNRTALLGSKRWREKKLTKEDKAFMSNLEKIFLRAFNGECDKFMGDVSWNNILRFEERMQKSYNSINDLGELHDLKISLKYLELRQAELRLKHEYKLKLEEEKEKQSRIREAIRDEEKAQKDFDRAQKAAAKEEKYYRDAMRLAEAKFAGASIEDRIKYGDQIQELEVKLKEAEERGKRAISMAQQTKSGCVYIISNIGSFGENIYKIGMTRRLEPMDRVKELGDASVPFTFDVHAIIRSDNAPALENILHRAFEKDRVNKVNMRKEFFNLDLSRIEELILSHDGSIEFTKEFTTEHEAKEYRETLELKKKEASKSIDVPISNEFETPDSLFSEN